MNGERVSRLSHRLLAALEDFYVDDPSHGQRLRKNTQSFSDLSKRERELKVVKSKKTQENLEKWFRRRDIPIRVVYSGVDFWDEETGRYKPSISPIGKPGVITFYYAPVGQDSPTAWMIVHNLSHAIYEPTVYNEESPYELTNERRHNLSAFQKSYPAQWEKTHNLMGRDLKRDPIYPTTRSYRNEQIEEIGEAFHELFAQWVVKGKVTLSPSNPKLEARLEHDFRNRIDYLADSGAVVYNV